MVYLGVGFLGFLFVVESLFSPIRNLIPVVVTSDGDLYLKVVEYEGYSINDYLDIALMALGIVLLFGAIGFWIKFKVRSNS